jgi:hypothetical protein
MESLALFVILLLLFSGCVKQFSEPPHNEILTMDDLYKEGAAGFVGEKILLKTKIAWRYQECGSIPKVYISPEECQERKRSISGIPTVVFDNILLYANLNLPGLPNPGNFYMAPTILTKKRDVFGFEQYAFNDKILSNNSKPYVFEGVLTYLDSYAERGIDTTKPTFTKQSNNPRYWSQTFQFNITNVYE